MKKVALLLSALLFLGCAAFGQALTQADRERSVKYLQQTRDGVVAAAASYPFLDHAGCIGPDADVESFVGEQVAQGAI